MFSAPQPNPTPEFPILSRSPRLITLQLSPVQWESNLRSTSSMHILFQTHATSLPISLNQYYPLSRNRHVVRDGLSIGTQLSMRRLSRGTTARHSFKGNDCLSQRVLFLWLKGYLNQVLGHGVLLCRNSGTGSSQEQI